MTVQIQPDLFRTLLSCLAGGVVVITATGERPVGFTATSFTSVSLHPPLVSFCLNTESSSWSTMSTTDYVAVHILAGTQAELARTFATRGIDRFAEPTRWHAGPHGVPLLDAGLATLLCRIVNRIPAGDHAIVLAEPVDGRLAEIGSAPLVYHRGRYLPARRIGRRHIRDSARRR